ncbi:MAG: MHYT domain-containing protein [Pseudomonadota bacterium]
MISGFTGLNLTKDLSSKSVSRRRIAVALAAVALGGGIWSMHFVAMLGLQMPILFYYDAAITLASALLAILIVAAALILLHFTERRPSHIVGAGALVGIGIASMHYVGMTALELCRAVSSGASIIGSTLLSIALCIAAVWVAYSERTNRNILLGTVCFGSAVAAVHFVATFQTSFVPVEGFSQFGPVMSNQALAIGVILSSFVILGTFLWVSTMYLTPEATAAEAQSSPSERPPEAPQLRVPCEKAGGRVYIRPDEVAFVRADGHYTQVYTDEGRLFCSWPITEAINRLCRAGHLHVHRSYVINPDKVASFEKRKDSGRCTFVSQNCPKVPVSRSKLKSVQEALGVKAA